MPRATILGGDEARGDGFGSEGGTGYPPGAADVRNLGLHEHRQIKYVYWI